MEDSLTPPTALLLACFWTVKTCVRVCLQISLCYPNFLKIYVR